VREARPEDAPKLHALRLEAGWDAEAIPAWYEAMGRGERGMWVAELEGRMVAMVAEDVADGKTTAAVTSLAVTAAAARRGLGRWLTLFAEEQARARGVRTLTLNTRPTNVAALALYQGLGYRPFKHAVRSWGEAVFLRKRLEGAP